MAGNEADSHVHSGDRVERAGQSCMGEYQACMGEYVHSGDSVERAVVPDRSGVVPEDAESGTASDCKPPSSTRSAWAHSSAN